MLQQECADDYVIATGKTHSVREFCELAFGCLGLDYRDYVREDQASFRPLEPALLVGCSDKARVQLSWKPEIEFEDLVRLMLDSEMDSLRGNI
jgi:GDPmannose 4,6-dehydratase